MRDAGSRNGTYLNGVRASHGALAPGDVLRIGDCVGVVSVNGPAPARLDLEEISPQLLAGEILADALEPARRCAAADLPIVLVGETGTGKERVARALHWWSGRRGQFHAINCATLPPALAEAELFGHTKGAFTGAERATEGRVRAAGRGTLLLDEIADLPLGMQPKLLRLLEENEIVPLGDDRAIRVDVRIIATTQVPLGDLVARGSFRQDLRARLSGVTVVLPPLRERKCEIIPLFRVFLNLHSGGCPPDVEATLAEALCLYPWPDNVRELDLLSRRLLALHGSATTLKRSFLPENMRGPERSANFEARSGWYPRRGQHDLRRLVLALKDCDGNVSIAAARLGFSRQRAYRLMNGRSASELMAEASIEAS
jgi:transcriptional regulator with PAS, ATPase and Fis domain